jgi:hypothetical protein
MSDSVLSNQLNSSPNSGLHKKLQQIETDFIQSKDNIKTLKIKNLTSTNISKNFMQIA